ncbi:MAG: HDOD domain-containing protein [Acidobacteria bacterium]|nr:HDOD domain-containing protein [Acidobacteriota bacterium]
MAVLAHQGANYRERIKKTLTELPPFSPILNRLLASLAQEDVSFSKIADLIEKDTVIAGNILRLVNSALYGRRGEINSVRSAVSLLGVIKLRNFVLGLSVSRMWSQVQWPKSCSAARFNQHGVATAVLADLIAQQSVVEYPEGAFIAGLFHDIGKMLIALGMRREWDEIYSNYHKGGTPLIECERQILGTTHAHLSGLAVSEWNLPEPIYRAVLQHHELPSMDPHGGPIPLAYVVSAADHYINRHGRSIDPDIQEIDLELPPMPHGMDFTEIEDEVLKKFEAELSALGAFFK